MKVCSRCDRELPLDAFHRRSDAPQGRRAACKECLRPYFEARYVEKRDDLLAGNKAWTLANPEKNCAKSLRWAKRHPEKVRANHATLRRKKPGIHRAANHRRRSRLAGAAGAGYTTAAHIAARVAFYGGRCRYCRGPYEAIDHRIPLARGGSHWPANLVPACKRCNSRKRARTELEFLDYLAREEVRH